MEESKQKLNGLVIDDVPTLYGSWDALARAMPESWIANLLSTPTFQGVAAPSTASLLALWEKIVSLELALKHMTASRDTALDLIVKFAADKRGLLKDLNTQSQEIKNFSEEIANLRSAAAEATANRISDREAIEEGDKALEYWRAELVQWQAESEEKYAAMKEDASMAWSVFAIIRTDRKQIDHGGDYRNDDIDKVVGYCTSGERARAYCAEQNETLRLLGNLIRPHKNYQEGAYYDTEQVACLDAKKDASSE